MKTFRPLVIAAVAAALLHASPAFAQRSIATYGQEAMVSLGHLLDKGAREGYSMEPRTTRIFGGWMPKGQKTGNEQWQSVLTLTSANPNKIYRIIAAGDNDTYDLDLRVLDPSGAIVVQDNLITREPEVTFRPTREQDYTIQFRLWHSRDNCVCIGAILTR
jgi:hypothetical protein